MHAIRNVILLLGVAAAGMAIAASNPLTKKHGGAHAERRSIAAIVASSPEFRTLGAALATATLADSLDDSGSHTLFAPTEVAFAKLPAGTVEDLLKPENHDKLVATLNYHIVPLTVSAKQLMKLKAVPTVNGDPITVTLDGKQVLVDNARVLKADIQASNGVIHAIDTLLVPDGK